MPDTPEEVALKEAKAKMFQYIAELSRRTGVDIDPEEAWQDGLARGKMHIHGDDDDNTHCPACMKESGTVPLCPGCGAIIDRGTPCKYCGEST